MTSLMVLQGLMTHISVSRCYYDHEIEQTTCCTAVLYPFPVKSQKMLSSILCIYQDVRCQSTCTYSNSYPANLYPSQLVPNTKSYPDQLIPTTNSYPNQLIKLHNNSNSVLSTGLCCLGSSWYWVRDGFGTSL